eukprot:scaffold14910_cov34-Phaeocystis_antarctica.AAC.1
MSRFMATHLQPHAREPATVWHGACNRVACSLMAPLLPMSAPTVVSSGWLSMKPSAHRAHPEYELSTVMTT